jgi:flagellar basal-body rod modification protein FlgD
MGTSAVGSVAGNNTISLQDFMQVLMTQLTYQDPLKPMDNQQFMAQIAQFTTLEQTQEMNTNIQALVSNQAAFQSVGLIGRTVNINTSTGTMTGTVTAIDLTGASPQLTIKVGTQVISNISLSQITSIT